MQSRFGPITVGRIRGIVYRHSGMDTTNASIKSMADLLRELKDTFVQHNALSVRYATNELICQAGSYAAGIYLVTAGIVHESYVGPMCEQPEVSTGLLGEPALLGCELLLPAGDTQLHSVSYRALTEVSLLFLEQSMFESAVEEDMLLRRFLTMHLVRHTQDLLRALWRSQLGAEGRLRELLKDLTPLAHPAAHKQLELPAEIDVRQLASLAHVSPRKTKQLCQTIPGLEWSGEQFRLDWDKLSGSPHKLSELRPTTSPQ